MGSGTNLLLQLVYSPGDLLVATLLVLLGHGLRQVLLQLLVQLFTHTHTHTSTDYAWMTSGRHSIELGASWGARPSPESAATTDSAANEIRRV